MPDLGVIKVVFGWLNRESPNMCHSRHFLKLFLPKLGQFRTFSGKKSKFSKCVSPPARQSLGILHIKSRSIFQNHPVPRVVEFSRIQVPNVKTYVFLRYKFPNFNFRTWRIAHTSIYRNFHDRKNIIVIGIEKFWSCLPKTRSLIYFFCQKLTFREFFSEKFVRFWLPRLVSDWWTSRSAIFGPKTI